MTEATSDGVTTATHALLQELALAEADLAKEQREVADGQERVSADEQSAAARAAAAALTAQQSVAAAVGDAGAAAALAASRSAPSLTTRDGHLQTTVDSVDPDVIGGAAADDGTAGSKKKSKKATGTALETTTRLPRLPSKRLMNSASAQSLHHQRRSAPSFGFGTASREQAQKLSASPDTLWGTESPGPARYTMLPSIGGKQPDKGSPPVWGFNKADRFLYGYGKPEHRPGPEAYRVKLKGSGAKGADPPMWSLQGRARAPVDPGLSSPGPAAYKLKSAVGGKSPDGRIKDAPSWRLTSRETMNVGVEPEKGVISPGPIYKVPRGLGRQPDSAFRSEPILSFAGAARTPIDPGTHSPGPVYNLPSAIEKQVSGHKASAPRPSFSRHSRWAANEAEMKRNTVPGPGHYG